MIETQVLMTASNFSGFFSRNHFLEGGFTFRLGGGGLFFRWGASFLSGGHPMASIVFDGGEFQRKKNHRIGGDPSMPTSPTTANPGM